MSSESVVDPTVQHTTGSVDGSDATEPQQHQPVRQAIEKVKSSNVVQYGLTKLAPVVDRIQPITSKVVEMSEPWIDTVDAQLSPALNSLSTHGGLPSTWYDSVNNILATSHVPTSNELKTRTQQFYDTLVDTFVTTVQAQREKRDEFVAAVQVRLNTLWEDALVTPSEQFFDRAKQLYVQLRAEKTEQTNDNISNNQQRATPPSPSSIRRALNTVKTRLPADWESKITEAYHKRFETPAKYVYQVAIEQYQKLTTAAARAKDNAVSHVPVVDVKSWMNSIRDSLGHEWNAKLETPLKELWSHISAHVPSPPHSLLQQSLSDVYSTTKGTAGSVYNSVVTTPYQYFTSSVWSQWQNVLSRLDNTLDSYLPSPESNEGEQDLVQQAAANAAIAGREHSLRDLNSKLQKRVVDHAKVGYVKLAKFSSESVAPKLNGVDPLKAAESGYERTNVQLKASAEQVSAALGKVKSQVETVQNMVTELEKSAVTTAKQVTATAVGTVKNTATQFHLPEYATSISERAHLEQLKSSLSHLKDSIVQLTQTNTDVLLHTPLNQLPVDLLHISSQLLYSSPQLLIGQAKFDVENDSTGVLKNVENLQESIKELLFFWSASEETTGEQKEGETPATAATTTTTSTPATETPVTCATTTTTAVAASPAVPASSEHKTSASSAAPAADSAASVSSADSSSPSVSASASPSASPVLNSTPEPSNNGQKKKKKAGNKKKTHGQ